jgi:cytochrome P450
MSQLTSDVIVLEDGKALPSGVGAPPRKPRWQDTLAYIANPDQFCHANLKQHGPIFKTGVFGGTTVFVGSSRAIQMVFNGDSNYTEIGLPPTTMEMFGEYSLFQRPDLHRQRKSALRPAFSGQMLAHYLPHIQRVIEPHFQRWETTAPMRLVPAVEEVCFDVLAPLLLGVNLDAEAFTGLPVASKAELKRLYKTFFDGFYGLLKWNSPLTVFGRGQRARSRLIEFMRAVVKRRRAAEEPLDATADFLSMMLASQQHDPEGVFSDALIENQCLLQLWASHYEVMGLVSAWIYQLGHYPELVQRLRSEQVLALGDESNLGSISLEQLKQMPFLEATIKETLRTLPPSSTATRRLTKSVILDGVLYEKGWGLIAEPRIAHAIADHFAQPERFDPDRFLPERGEGRMYEFIPFGGGVHACLGAQLAMVVTKAFAVHLLHQFDWKLLGEATFIQFPLKKIQDNYEVQFVRRELPS